MTSDERDTLTETATTDPAQTPTAVAPIALTPTALTLILNPDAPLGTAARLVDAPTNEPHVLVTDLGLNRGDGIFEVAGCMEGRVQALDAHLARLARSASAMDLPAPNLDIFAAAVHRCVDALTARFPQREISVKFLYTRGQEIGAPSFEPVGLAFAYLTADYTRERTGIRVVTLDRGLSSGVARTSPWLLAGVKFLSYAANRAALREAHRRDADDVLFISSDGHALEGPTSSLIARIDGVLVTPPADEGILAGTTQADVFRYAAAHEIPTRVRPIWVDELAEADALWLTSSSRLVAPVRSLDGRDIAMDAAFAAELNEFLLARG